MYFLFFPHVLHPYYNFSSLPSPTSLFPQIHLLSEENRPLRAINQAEMADSSYSPSVMNGSMRCVQRHSS